MSKEHAYAYEAGYQDGLGASANALKAENTKLRELVADMWNWLAPTAVGGAAPLRGLHDRMRELGIEVGG